MPPVQAVLLDLEGTLYAKEEVLPGAVEAIARLREQGMLLRFLTNTDSQPTRRIRDLLRGYGIGVADDELFTPLTAAENLFGAAPDARVYPLISADVRGEFSVLADEPPYTHVLVGDCRDTLDYPSLDGAFRALRGGAGLVALQRGRYFTRADGEHLDTGAIVAALEYAGGVTARVLGKPATDFFELAADSVGVPIGRCLVVGDDATTDIAGARAAGATAVQVRTGKYAAQVAEGVHGRAHHVVDDIGDVPPLVERLIQR